MDSASPCDSSSFPIRSVRLLRFENLCTLSFGALGQTRNGAKMCRSQTAYTPCALSLKAWQDAQGFKQRCALEPPHARGLGNRDRESRATWRFMGGLGVTLSKVRLGHCNSPEAKRSEVRSPTCHPTCNIL